MNAKQKKALVVGLSLLVAGGLGWAVSRGYLTPEAAESIEATVTPELPVLVEAVPDAPPDAEPMPESE